MGEQDESWWAAVERWATRPEGPPPGGATQQAVAAVLQADLAFDFEAAKTALQGIRTEASADVVDLLDLQLRLRSARGEAFDALANEALALAQRTSAPIAARALHLAGLARLRRGQADDAAAHVLDGLLLDPWDGRRTWMMDTLAGILIDAGGWIEAERTLDHVASLRRELGDPIGVAITAGRRANLALDLDNPGRAEELAGQAIRDVGEQLPAGSRLRLNTLRLMAALDASAPRPGLVQTLAEDIAATDVGYLRGYAALALMRSPGADRGAWLEVARQGLASPQGRALVEAWTEHLDGTRPPEPATRAGPANDATFQACLLRAERAHQQGISDLAVRWLERAAELATAANRPLWMTRVDSRFATIDPIRHAQQVARRYSGLSAEAAARTVQEDVTIVFNDLVGFTRRSVRIGPQATMDTVRSLFELTAPVLATFRVRPLQYLGDGLLAVAQGPDHATRGVTFAKHLVRRTGTATRIRHARGEPLGLVTRAGVASGPVVLGLLGSFAKMEHLAIGQTTNLAARLQGVAEPGQVISPAELHTGAETVALKGIDQPMPILRHVVHPASLAL